jgi:DivIVA domain-containing protein
MSLDRQSIEKRDFPIGRRGYDPEAVDAHLAAIAADVEELKLSAHRRTETLATSASDQIRTIIEAAENSAREIQGQAETEARAVRAEATEEATATREDANVQAREYVSGVHEATAGMLQRLEAMESELGQLLEGLRTGANRLTADLQLLESNFDEVRGSVAPRTPKFEPETVEQPQTKRSSGQSSTSTSGLGSAPTDRIVDDFQAPAQAADGDAAEAADDAEDARLVALNMALDGTAREETDKYLEANFKLADRTGLLDEVYASVSG